MELPGLSGRRPLAQAAHRRAPRRTAAPLALTVFALLALLMPAGAAAATRNGVVTRTVVATRTAVVTRTATDSDTPVLVTERHSPPAGYRLTAVAVQRIAARDPRIRAELRRHPRAVAYEYTKGPGRWQVSWFSAGRPEKELAQVYVDDATGKVTEAWTGFQVAWTMARGYPGAFGRQVNAWYVWIPMCLAFVAPFLPWRRRPTLFHLDLLVLLGFSISMAFFNHAAIGLSVPLVYPFMVYLLVRLLALAFGRGRPREPLRVLVPTAWLAIAVVFLVGFRVGLNVSDSNVIDVGYAGVIGAHKLVHGQPLYGHWPKDNAYGDTYGPVNYYAYVPALAALGWSGRWDSLAAAHAAAIVFDLLTLLGLYLLGRRIRGPTLGVALAYAWVAYPFSLYALNSNSNDSLVALLVVVALLAVGSAPARGIAAALAGLTKFAPLGLAPLLLRGTGSQWPRRRSVVAYVLCYALTAVAVMLPVLLDGNLRVFWHDTIAYQAGRPAPFSIWGLWGGLSVVQHLVQGAAVALALVVAVLPRRRTVVDVAALGAAVLVTVQLGVTYWFYLYIMWFFPLVVAALFGSHPARQEAAGPTEPSGEQRAGEPLVAAPA